MSDDLFNLPEPEAPQTSAAPSADNYDESSIQTLKWNEHIRRRPGMYIGKLGDGTYSDDGIYILMKEVIDNSIDEFNMGKGSRIDIDVSEEGTVRVRDYGRGIPLGKVKEVASDINTGGKFDSKSFQKSVGLNGVGLKAVNAMSTKCTVSSVRDGKMVTVKFDKGDLIEHTEPLDTTEPNGTIVEFTPDPILFGDFKFRPETIEMMVNNYTYLNVGLQIFLNGKNTARATVCSILSRMLWPARNAPHPSILSSISRATTSKWCSPTPTKTARNISHLSTGSTPPRAAPISRPSESMCAARSRIIPGKVMNIPTSGREWWPPSRSGSRSRCSKARQR